MIIIDYHNYKLQQTSSENSPKMQFFHTRLRTRRNPWRIKKNGRFLYLPLELVIPAGIEPALPPWEGGVLGR